MGSHCACLHAHPAYSASHGIGLHTSVGRYLVTLVYTIMGPPHKPPILKVPCKVLVHTCKVAQPSNIQSNLRASHSVEPLAFAPGTARTLNSHDGLLGAPSLFPAPIPASPDSRLHDAHLVRPAIPALEHRSHPIAPTQRCKFPSISQTPPSELRVPRTE